MKKFRFITVLMMILMIFALAATAPAATTNPSPASSGYMVIPVVFDRTISAVSTPVIFRIKAPFPCKVVGVTAAAETIDLTSADETYTVDIKEGATSILSSAIGIAAQATVYSGTVSDTKIADEAVLTGVLSVAGTTPSVTTVTVVLVLKRL